MMFKKTLLPLHILLLFSPESDGSAATRYIRPESNKRIPRHQRMGGSMRQRQLQPFEKETSSNPELIYFQQTSSDTELIDVQQTAGESRHLLDSEAIRSGMSQISKTTVMASLLWFVL